MKVENFEPNWAVENENKIPVRYNTKVQINCFGFKKPDIKSPRSSALALSLLN